jgi:hypothetical protein
MLARVGHNKRLTRSDHLLAKRVSQFGFPRLARPATQPARRFEELFLVVHQRDERNRHLQAPANQSREPIETRLLGRIEQVQALQRRQPGRIIEGFRMKSHVNASKVI